MKRIRFIALVLSLFCIIPLVIIPASWGVSISDLALEFTESSLPESRSMMIAYSLLDLYYYFFILSNLFPVLFLSISSSLSISKEKRKTREAKSENNGCYCYSDIFSGSRFPKVSIIIPCYNEALHVSATITSCFRQDYRGEIEIIVVDDGSKDRTWSIGKIFKTNEKGRDIRIFHKQNGGKASALRQGIFKSSGEILLMTDGDSGIDPNAVSSIVDTFRAHPDAGIVGGYVFIKNTHSGYLTKLQQLEYIITQHLIRINQSEDGSVLIAPGPIFGMRADLARTLPPLERTIVEDCDLTMSVLPTAFTTRSTIGAVSHTTAPTTWMAWIRQRKRWIYGQFQAWRENRWHLKRNPWGLYTYFTWVTTTLSSIIFVITLFFTTGLLISGGDYYRFLEFISIRTSLVFLTYLFARTLVLLQYREGRKMLPLLPLKVMYDLVNGFLTAYLYIRYITGRGVKMIWGNRSGVVY